MQYDPYLDAYVYTPHQTGVMKSYLDPPPREFIYNFVGFYGNIPEDIDVVENAPVQNVRHLLSIFKELCQQENIDTNDAYCVYSISAPYPECIHETQSIVSIRSTPEVPEEKLIRIKSILKKLLASWEITDPNHPANRNF
jgi:hypothetical protein